jgi:hypothetical protein
MRRTAPARLLVPALLTLALLAAPPVNAASFVVPTDEELVSKSPLIVVATVEGAYAQTADDIIETVYEMRVQRTLKGAPASSGLLRVHALGGVIGERGVLVPGEAHFRQGQQVLLFLSRDEQGRWRTTDLTLGKFRFVLSTRGERLLVRDMEDVVGWDHAGRVHREKVRREEGFLRFVEERARGRAAANDYVVEASEVTLAAEEPARQIGVNAALFPAATYTDWVNNQPVRWPSMGNGIPVHKRIDQDIAGAADGGVSVIQGALAAWTNDCASTIVLTYAGEIAKASLNHDGVNVVEFNDPQSRIAGSWGGSGTVGICFVSFAGEHTFNGQSWLNITGMDVVFQNGYTAANASFRTAMTHEVGHGIGWRHSNQDYATGGACNSATQECTSAAIMNSSVNSSYGYTLQAWDRHAAESVYPGGTCGPVCTPPVVTGHPQSASVAPGQPATLSVTATGSAPLSYQWYVGTSGNTANPIVGETGPSMAVTPGTTTSYWVRVANACGAANSNTATVNVSTTALAAATASRLYLVSPCRVIDTRSGDPAAPASVYLVQVTGRCGIPAGAKSVAFNITAVTPSGTGYLNVYPGNGSAPPGTSTLSYRPNRTRANNGVMRLSADGRLGVYNGGPSVHFLIDVTGYFQ